MALLDKLASLLYPRGDKFDKNVKKAWSKNGERIIATKGLMTGKNQVIEGETSFIVFKIKLGDGHPWTKVYHTCIKPFCLPYFIQIRLRGTF